MNISLQQFRAFSAVARLGSFTAAAKSMHLTSAAVSALIKELEAELGFVLFHRTTRQVGLSDQGSSYLPHAERVLEDLRVAKRVADDMRNQKSGLVRIAMTPLMQLTLLPQVFMSFQAMWPEVRMDLVDVPSDQLLSSLEAGHADVAISLEQPESNFMSAELLFISRIHAALPTSHHLQDRATIKWKNLSGEPLILPNQAMELRVRSALPEDIPLDFRYCANNSITAFALAASGAGIAICPGYSRPLANVHSLKLIPLAGPTIDRKFLLYRSKRASSFAVTAYCDFITQRFAKFRAQPIERSSIASTVL
ncbi:LysR family transcriptional regulator [Ottowia thiooxydans]|uniref:LysR family transcriptional regulator n=1 Tax=Ottowia thiooxydans TaxID=219182 RepID=UPI0004116E91|nr:LysR family transcriptional regulator [Ottowia thiooxydans]